MADYSLNISSYTGAFMKEMYRKMENDLSCSMAFASILTENVSSYNTNVYYNSKIEKEREEKENKMVNSIDFSYVYNCGINGSPLLNLAEGTPKKKQTVPEVKQIIYNKKSTICIWSDDTKTRVTCGENDTYSEETGVAMCFMKKIFGDRSKFLKLVRKGYSQVDRKSKESKDQV